MKDSAVLLIDCPDRKGLVARVSGLLYERGANILHADQHQDHDLGLFFMRVEWSLNGHADGELSVAREAETQSKTPLHAVLPPSAGPAGRFDLEGFKAAFAPLARELGMRWKLSSGA